MAINNPFMETSIFNPSRSPLVVSPLFSTLVVSLPIPYLFRPQYHFLSCRFAPIFEKNNNNLSYLARWVHGRVAGGWIDGRTEG